jgi:hypothetical protein
VRVTDQGASVEEVISDVKLAIKEANISAADEDRDLRVSSVQLKLHVLATRSLGGRLEFRVPVIGMQVKLGRKLTKADTSEIEISLVPPAGPAGAEIRGGIDDALVEAIETIRAAIAAGAGGNDPFIFQDAKVTLSFAVTADGEISIGVDGSLTEELTHTLTLGLGPA